MNLNDFILALVMVWLFPPVGIPLVLLILLMDFSVNRQLDFSVNRQLKKPEQEPISPPLSLVKIACIESKVKTWNSMTVAERDDWFSHVSVLTPTPEEWAAYKASKAPKLQMPPAPRLGYY